MVDVVDVDTKYTNVVCKHPGDNELNRLRGTNCGWISQPNQNSNRISLLPYSLGCRETDSALFQKFHKGGSFLPTLTNALAIKNQPFSVQVLVVHTTCYPVVLHA